MTNKENDILKKLIQKVELDKPALNFTSSVMEEVKAEARNEIVTSPVLKSLLRGNTVSEKLPVNFTHTIMAQVTKPNHASTYKPIISNRAWIVITTIMTSFIVLLIFYQQGATSPQSFTSYVVSMGNEVNTVLKNVNAIPSLYLITLVSLCALVLFDYFIRSKSQDHKKKSMTLME